MTSIFAPFSISAFEGTLMISLVIGLGEVVLISSTSKMSVDPGKIQGSLFYSFFQFGMHGSKFIFRAL